MEVVKLRSVVVGDVGVVENEARMAAQLPVLWAFEAVLLIPWEVCSVITQASHLL